MLWLARVRTADLITLGEAFEDLIFLDLARLPGPGEEIKTNGFARTVGGGAVITAVAAARLGLRCEVYSGLGNEGAARVTREGVRVTNLKRDNEPHAISAALSTRANRTFVTFNGINDRLEPRLLRTLPKLRARHVHLALQPRDCRPWCTAILALRRRGVTCSWDFGWSRALLGDRNFWRLVNTLDLVFVNDQEALLYAKKRALPTAFDFWRRLDARVVVKLGRRGSCILLPAGVLRVTAPRMVAMDTTGAGDAFNGGFLYGRLNGWSDDASLRLGSFVGSMSTREAGGLDGLPTASEVAAYGPRDTRRDA